MSLSLATIQNRLFITILFMMLTPMSLYAESETKDEPAAITTQAQSSQEQLATEKQAADKQAVDKLVRPTTTNVDVVQIITALAGVIALIVAVSWLMRRMGNVTGQRNDQLNVVAALSMGARERVVLLQVGEQQLLLGVAPGRIQTLHVLEQPLDMNSASRPGAAFQDRLKKIMSRESES